jgi:hypothetical protein
MARITRDLLIIVALILLGIFSLKGLYHGFVSGTRFDVFASSAPVAGQFTDDQVATILANPKFKAALITTDDQRKLLVDTILVDPRIKALDLSDDKRKLLVADVVTAVFADSRMVNLLADVAKLKSDAATVQQALDNQTGTNKSLQDQITQLKTPPAAAQTAAPTTAPAVANSREFVTAQAGTTTTVTLAGNSVVIDLSQVALKSDLDKKANTEDVDTKLYSKVDRKEFTDFTRKFPDGFDFSQFATIVTVQEAVDYLDRKKADVWKVEPLIGQVAANSSEIAKQGGLAAQAKPAQASTPVVSPVATANGTCSPNLSSEDWKACGHVNYGNKCGPWSKGPCSAPVETANIPPPTAEQLKAFLQYAPR